jgi:Bacterial low temperature requirement A protein (LtrA)
MDDPVFPSPPVVGTTPANVTVDDRLADDDTVLRSGNAHKVNATKAAMPSLSSTTRDAATASLSDEVVTPMKKSKSSGGKSPGSGFVVSLAEQLRSAQEQITLEKAGKRKLFHSLVKVANELRKSREQQAMMESDAAESNKQWYDGGLWRAPQILPGVTHHTRPTSTPHQPRVLREAISLSDLFFHLVIVTAFTRVGVAISSMGYVDSKSFLYFAIFWNIWSKEEGYTTRFDTTDLSAQMENLVTCFAVLFGSLSVQADINSIDGTRIMYMAASVAVLHCALHVRVAISNWRGQIVSPSLVVTESERSIRNPLSLHVFHYALFTIIANALEAIVWMVGIFVYPYNWPYRWCIVTAGIILGLRVPRAFLANDFHGTRFVVCLLLLY